MAWMCTTILPRNLWNYSLNFYTIIFNCDQATLRTLRSICPSVHLPVTPFLLCSHHQIIMKFSGVITIDISHVHAKGPGHRGQNLIKPFPDCNTSLNSCMAMKWWTKLMWYRRGAILFFKVIYQISRSHGTKTSILTWIEGFWIVTPVWIHRWLWNNAQSLTYHRTGALLFCRVIHWIWRSCMPKNQWFESNLNKITRLVVTIKSLRFAFVELILMIDSLDLSCETHYLGLDVINQHYQC